MKYTSLQNTMSLNYNPLANVIVIEGNIEARLAKDQHVVILEVR